MEFELVDHREIFAGLDMRRWKECGRKRNMLCDGADFIGSGNGNCNCSSSRLLKSGSNLFSTKFVAGSLHFMPASSEERDRATIKGVGHVMISEPDLRHEEKLGKKKIIARCNASHDDEVVCARKSSSRHLIDSLDLSISVTSNENDKSNSSELQSDSARYARQTPVPMITVGRVYAPILSGRPSASLEMLEAAEIFGFGPLMAAAIGETEKDSRKFWKLSSLTDPITATGLLQGAKSPCGKRLLFVERSAAEDVAREKLSVFPIVDSSRRPPVWRNLLKKFDAFLNIFSLQEEPRRYGNKILLAKERSGARMPDVSVPLRFELRKAPSILRNKKRKHKKIFKGKLLEKQERTPFLDELQSIMDDTGRMDPAAGLAGIPTRIALDLLAHLPHEFSILSRATKTRNCHKASDGPEKNMRHNAMQKQARVLKSEADGAESMPKGKSISHVSNDCIRKNLDRIKEKPKYSFYSGADAVQNLVVHTLKGFEIIQQTGEEGVTCRFTPAFISRESLDEFWLNLSEFLKLNALKQRQSQRKTFNRQLIAGLARLAAPPGIGGGGDGTEGRSGYGNDDGSDIEGFEDPPEMQEVIREMQGNFDTSNSALTSDDKVPQGSLVRAAATFGCGLVSLLAPAVEGIGSLSDVTLTKIPGGNYILGIPSLTDIVESQSLNCLVQECKEHNNTARVTVEGREATHAQNTDITSSSFPDWKRSQLKDFNKELSIGALWTAIVVKLSLDLLSQSMGHSSQKKSGGVDKKGRNLGKPHGQYLSSPGIPHSIGGLLGASRFPTVLPMPRHTAFSAQAPDSGNASSFLMGREGVAAFLSQFIPSLEYNGFRNVINSFGTYEERKKAAMELVPEDGTMGIGVQLAVSEMEFMSKKDHMDLHKNDGKEEQDGAEAVPKTKSTEEGSTDGVKNIELKDIPDSSLASSSESKNQSTEGTRDGRGIILIGCCDRSNLNRTEDSGLWSMKEGVEVGVLDGSKYLDESTDGQ